MGASPHGARPSLARELRHRRVSLLVVDAEAHDYEVLAQFPFGRVPVERVVFEATHMRNADFDAAAALLSSHGFVPLRGGFKAASNVWHAAPPDS